MATALQAETGEGSRPHSQERWALLLPHRGRLIRLATNKLGDPHYAEDCVHEAFLRAVSFHNLDDRRAGCFLTTVTVRLCVDHHRAHVRARNLLNRLWDSNHDEGPEDQVCDRAAGAWLQDQLTQLSQRERDVLDKRVAGLTIPETAIALGITRKAAESAFTRARAKMQGQAAIAA